MGTTDGRCGCVMGCGCAKRRHNSPAPVNKDVKNILEEHRYLKPHQIQARLEVFKRNYCTNCESRYQCDYSMYLKCDKRPK